MLKDSTKILNVKIWTCDKGASLVLVALMMTVLFGFSALAVDYGKFVSEKRALVTDADAASLAGAQEFGQSVLQGKTKSEAETAAIASAKDYAVKNGIIESEIESIIIDKDASGNYIRPYKIRVNVKRESDYIFGKVLNFNTMDIRAHAAAITGPVVSGIGISPVFFPDAPTANPGTEYILKYGANNDVNNYIGGTYGALDIEGSDSTGSEYSEYLKLGYPGSISIGQYIDSLDGNKIGTTTDAIAPYALKGDTDSRIQRCLNYCTHGPITPTDLQNDPTIVAGCPRVITVPVVSLAEFDSNNKKVKVVDFAAFYISDYKNPPGETGAGKEAIYGYFMNYFNAVGVVDDNPDNYSTEGVWAVNLDKL
jgi:hypothetical protein